MTARIPGCWYVARVGLLLVVLLPARAALAGPDDDAPLRSDGVTGNAVGPFLGGGVLADFATNAEPTTGLRILPPGGTHLATGQRFDLRVETQIPAQGTVTLD